MTPTLRDYRSSDAVADDHSPKLSKGAVSTVAQTETLWGGTRAPPPELRVPHPPRSYREPTAVYRLWRVNLGVLRGLLPPTFYDT